MIVPKVGKADTDDNDFLNNDSADELSSSSSEDVGNEDVETSGKNKVGLSDFVVPKTKNEIQVFLLRFIVRIPLV